MLMDKILFTFHFIPDESIRMSLDPMGIYHTKPTIFMSGKYTVRPNGERYSIDDIEFGTPGGAVVEPAVLLDLGPLRSLRRVEIFGS